MKEWERRGCCEGVKEKGEDRDGISGGARGTREARGIEKKGGNLRNGWGRNLVATHAFLIVATSSRAVFYGWRGRPGRVSDARFLWLLRSGKRADAVFSPKGVLATSCLLLANPFILHLF